MNQFTNAPAPSQEEFDALADQIGTMPTIKTATLNSSSPVVLSFSDTARLLLIIQAGHVDRSGMSSLVGTSGNCYHNDIQMGSNISVTTSSGKITVTSASSQNSVCILLIFVGANSITIS